MGEFNSDDHYIYYCGQESLRRSEVAIIVNKESEMQYLGAISKSTCWEDWGQEKGTTEDEMAGWHH